MCRLLKNDASIEMYYSSITRNDTRAVRAGSLVLSKANMNLAINRLFQFSIQT